MEALKGGGRSFLVAGKYVDAIESGLLNTSLARQGFLPSGQLMSRIPNVKATVALFALSRDYMAERAQYLVVLARRRASPLLYNVSERACCSAGGHVGEAVLPLTCAGPL